MEAVPDGHVLIDLSVMFISVHTGTQQASDALLASTTPAKEMGIL